MNGLHKVWTGVDPASGQDMVGIWSPRETRCVLSPFTAIRLAGALCTVDENELVSHRRAERLVDARALVVWMLRTIPSAPMSYPKIGRALGGRDHSTIIELHRRAIRLRLADDVFSRCCDALLTYFKQMEKAHGCIPAFG